ncbi:MAG: hypothetical protein NWE96_01135 [Candidatus Bathyarchaeota archaeon]|nr:hypothetical protein [Candidatus Bathyarchaeota archaeon]
MSERKYKPKARLTAITGLALLLGITIATYLSSYDPEAFQKIYPNWFFFFWGIGLTSLASAMEISILETRIKLLEEKLKPKNP